MRSEFLCLEVQLVSVANGRVSADLCILVQAQLVLRRKVGVEEAELESGQPQTDSLGKQMRDPATAFPPLNKGTFA